MKDYQASWSRLRTEPPLLTFALALSAAVTTVPQFILGDLYDSLTGTLLGLRVPHYFFLPTFSHSPAILPAHFMGNLLILLVFGGLTERLLGRYRFSLLTLATLATSSVMAYARGLDTMHGISGVIWAYHAPALLYLIARAEQTGWRVLLKKPLPLLMLLLFLFDFIGLPLLEVALLGQRFFANFGQVMHLASVVTALPFVLIWRRRIESEATLSTKNEVKVGPGGAQKRRLPAAILAALLAVNLAGTLDAIVQSSRWQTGAVVTIDPPLETPPSELGKAVLITFDREMIQAQPRSVRRSVWYDEEPAPEFTFQWLTPRLLQVELSRPLLQDESFTLEFDVLEIGPRRVPLRTVVALEYGDSRRGLE